MGIISKLKTKLHVGKHDGARSAEKRSPRISLPGDNDQQPRDLNHDYPAAKAANGKAVDGPGSSAADAPKAPKAHLVMEGVPVGPDGKQPNLGMLWILAVPSERG